MKFESVHILTYKESGIHATQWQSCAIHVKYDNATKVIKNCPKNMNASLFEIDLMQ